MHSDDTVVKRFLSNDIIDERSIVRDKFSLNYEAIHLHTRIFDMSKK